MSLFDKVGDVILDIVSVFEEHSKYIYSYALKLTRNVDNAEDLTQETFLVAIDKLNQLNNENSVKYWLRSICFNCYLMKIRKGKNVSIISYDAFQSSNNIELLLLKKTTLTTSDDELIVDETINKIQSVCFLSMVHHMKDNQRIIFSLIDMFGLSIQEVSEIMEISKSAVKSQLYRARKKIDEELLDKCGLLTVGNPCSCKAWEKFVCEREQRKANARWIKNKNSMSFSGNERNEAIKTIRKLFSQMVDFKPSNEWYEKVIHELRKIISKTTLR